VQAAKALALTAVAIVLFLVPAIPAHLTALLVGGVVLTSRRMRTRDALVLVNWHLLALFAGLFVVMGGFVQAGGTRAIHDALASTGVDLTHPIALIVVVTLASLLVGNVPAVMLLLTLLPRDPQVGHAVALASTLSGNAILPGSIANLIVAEQAAKEGVHLGFVAHARAALPVTLFSLAVAAVLLLAIDRWVPS
jgi:Na+/H+ antiporter NhaD/arsenite permease-like protein